MDERRRQLAEIRARRRSPQPTPGATSNVQSGLVEQLGLAGVDRAAARKDSPNASARTGQNAEKEQAVGGAVLASFPPVATVQVSYCAICGACLTLTVRSLSSCAHCHRSACSNDWRSPLRRPLLAFSSPRVR